jgi:hypothetical protein
MKIQNVNGFTADQLHSEVLKGAKFVHFAYSVSLLFITLNRETGVYMIRPNEKAAKKAMPFTVLTFLFGWWGFPFGPKYSLASIRTNMKGGKDVTDEISAIIDGHLLFRESQQKKGIQLQRRSSI